MDRDLKLRTKKFPHRCVKLCNALPNNSLGKYIAGQLMRSGLSTAANYRATCLAQSKKEFISKISIVLEEADECLFWIEFIEDEKLIEINKLLPLKNESNELTKIFAASRLTAKTNSKKKSKEHS